MVRSNIKDSGNHEAAFAVFSLFLLFPGQGHIQGQVDSLSQFWPAAKVENNGRRQQNHV